MAKALLGHLGGPDPSSSPRSRGSAAAYATSRTRSIGCSAVNDALTAVLAEDQVLTVTDREPVLT